MNTFSNVDTRRGGNKPFHADLPPTSPPKFKAHGQRTPIQGASLKYPVENDARNFAADVMLKHKQK